MRYQLKGNVNVLGQQNALLAHGADYQLLAAHILFSEQHVLGVLEHCPEFFERQVFQEECFTLRCVSSILRESALTGHDERVRLSSRRPNLLQKLSKNSVNEVHLLFHLIRSNHGCYDLGVLVHDRVSVRQQQLLQGAHALAVHYRDEVDGCVEHVW